MKKTALLFAFLVAVLASGCTDNGGASTTAAEIVTVEQTCEQIAPSGGSGPLTEAAEYVSDAMETHDYDQQMFNRAVELTETFEPIIASSHPSIRAYLQDYIAVPAAVVEAVRNDQGSLNVPLDKFSPAAEELQQMCLTDPRDATASPSVSPTDSAAAITTPSLNPRSTPTPSRTPEKEGAVVSLNCWYGKPGNNVRGQFSTYQEGWKLAEKAGTGDGMCYDSQFLGGTLTATEHEAVKIAYGMDAKDEKIVHLYGICALPEGIMIDEVRSGAQAKELSGAIIACPDHPKIEEMKAAAASGQAMIEQDKQVAQARQNGTFIESRETPYRVGKEIQPGTYKTVSQQITDCYWEISDAAGNIIDNNFATFATEITVTIPTSATGFTSNRCGGWIKVG